MGVNGLYMYFQNSPVVEFQMILNMPLWDDWLNHADHFASNTILILSMNIIPEQHWAQAQMAQ
jgi:hypothetical protein